MGECLFRSTEVLIDEFDLFGGVVPLVGIVVLLEEFSLQWFAAVDPTGEVVTRQLGSCGIGEVLHRKLVLAD